MSFRKLLNGYRSFHDNYFKSQPELFDRLVNDGQAPKVMVIACSDSRIDPAILTQSEPGDIFAVRNIAAMVPPDDNADHRGHDVSAAVEYAVKFLHVEHIVILGHALCGGIRALAESGDDLGKDNSFISRWIEISTESRDEVRKAFPDEPIEEQAKLMEKAAILGSLKHLMTYQWVHDAVEAGKLKLHGWYFDMPNQALLNYDPTTNKFENVLAVSVRAAIETPCCDCDTAIPSIVNYLTQAKGVNPPKKTGCFCGVGEKVKGFFKGLIAATPELSIALLEMAN